MMKIFSGQRGSESAYTLIGVVAILILGYLVFVFAVPFFKNMSLEGYAQKLVNYDYQNKRPEPTEAKSIYNKLQSFIKQKNLPIPETQISVDYDQKKYEVKIFYQQRVNLIVTDFDWKFEIYKATEENY